MPTTNLSKKVKMIWGFSLHGWEDVMRFSLAVVGVFGLIVGLSTWFVVRLQRTEIEQSRIELEEYKVTAGKEVAVAKAVADTARADVEKAHVEISNANKEAAVARLEQERLKAQLAWRVLTPEIAARLEAALTSNPGNVNIRHTANDPEALYFAIQLANIFAKARWAVGFSSQTIGGMMVFGLIVPDTATVSTPLLRSAFAAANIGFSSQSLAPTSGATVVVGGPGNSVSEAALLYVGSKPPPQ
jgi:hypothetical protein